VNPTHERDGGRCVVTGKPAQTTHHRVHGNRSDMRPSNLLSVQGDGTVGAHSWIEHHPAAAGLDSLLGWYVSKHDQRDLTEIPVWYEAGPFGQGLYLLDDSWGFAAWPGSLVWQDRLAKLEEQIRAERSTAPPTGV
jgi:hypothetical protein